MDIEEFPYCCTAKVLCDFGESSTSEGGGFGVDYEEEKRNCLDWIKWAKRHGLVMLTATTNNEQKTANKVLKECGFKRTRWMTKKAHPETKVCLWWIQLDQV